VPTKMINDIYESLVSESSQSIEDLKKKSNVFWHGSPSGELKGTHLGIHVGTHETDIQANALMIRQVKQGRAKRGYYYINEGEDVGSISAVVPNKDHLERLPFSIPVTEGFRDTLRTAAVSAGLGAAAVLGGQHMMKSKTPPDAPSSFVIDDTEKSDAGVGISKNVDSGASSFAREQLGEELPTIKRAAIRNGIQPGTEDFAILLAIRKAEGGCAGREFGVLHPRAVDTDLETQAAWAAATIMRNRERWDKAGRPDDFITFLGNRYAPINSENDPTGLNRNWVSNVKYWTARFLND
jgi:hypothetical protein